MARKATSPFEVEVSESTLDTLHMPKSVLSWSIWLLDACGDAGDAVTSAPFSNSDQRENPKKKTRKEKKRKKRKKGVSMFTTIREMSCVLGLRE